jgi:hypothetical protein
MESRAVGDRTVRHVEYNHSMGLLVDQLADAPLLPTARGVLASVFIAERMADAIRIVQERSDDELGDRRGDLFRKVGELALRPRTHVKAPAPASIAHAAPVRRSR